MTKNAPLLIFIGVLISFFALFLAFPRIFESGTFYNDENKTESAFWSEETPPVFPPLDKEAYDKKLIELANNPPPPPRGPPRGGGHPPPPPGARGGGGTTPRPPPPRQYSAPRANSSLACPSCLSQCWRHFAFSQDCGLLRKFIFKKDGSLGGVSRRRNASEA